MTDGPGTPAGADAGRDFDDVFAPPDAWDAGPRDGSDDPPGPDLPWTGDPPPGERPGAPLPVLVGTAISAVLCAVFAVSAGLGANALVISAAVAGTAAAAVRGTGRRPRPWTLVWALGGLFLVAVPLWRGDDWYSAFSFAVALGAASLALTGGHAWWHMFTRPFAVLILAPRGLAWVYRGLSGIMPRRRGDTGAALRAVAVTAAVAAVFAALFAAADAVFAEILADLAPDGGSGEFFARVGFAALGTAFAAGAATAAFAPPRGDQLFWRIPALPRVPVRRRVEWAMPLIVLDLLFLGFVTVQSVVLFGGDDGPLDDAGTTRAEYAREGFWQLWWVTLLTLGVIALARYVVPRDRPGDRRLADALLAVLIVLALVVGASSLYRSDAYIDDLGLNRTRLVMAGAELWMCAVLLMVLVALAWRAAVPVLPRTTAVAAVLTVAVIAAASPDAMIADQRVRLFERTGRIDLAYVRGLGVDAVPALDRLPEPYRSCALRDLWHDLADDRPWYATSLARERAADILRDRPVDSRAVCDEPGRFATAPEDRRR